MRNRLTALVAAVFLAGLGLFFAPSAANAASLCTAASLQGQGWAHRGTIYATGLPGTLKDAGMEGWAKGNAKLIRFGNYVADGKTNVLVFAGTGPNSRDLGASHTIGTAPSGGFCTNPTTSRNIWAELDFTHGMWNYTTGNRHVLSMDTAK